MNNAERIAFAADSIKAHTDMIRENRKQIKEFEKLDGFHNRLMMFVQEKKLPCEGAESFDEVMCFLLSEFEDFNNDLEYMMATGNLEGDVLCEQILGKQP